jgi:glycosyltransferase involved in cell wall biosynthesis
MKILAINDYQLDVDRLNGDQNLRPSQHCWGMDYFIKKGHQVDVKIFLCKYNNRFLILLDRFIFNIKILILSWRYDAVIAFNSPFIDFMGLFKMLHLTKAKVYTFIHHRGKKYQASKGFDKIFFISKKIMKYYQDDGLTKCLYTEWGPDLDSYESSRKMTTPNNEKLRFISTGKTNRDFKIMKDVFKDTGTSITIINSHEILIDDKVILTKENNPIYKYIINPVKMHEYMNNCDVTIIPIIPNISSSSLCGLTSFLDALALGQPILMSDNTNISVDIDTLKIGLTYKAGDYDDLKAKILYMKENPELLKEMGINARKYAEQHDYSAFCRVLYNAIVPE